MASASYEPGQPDAWQEPPAVTLHLKPISRANRGDPHLEDPVIDNRTIIRELVIQHENKLKEQQARFIRLFADGELDIGTIKMIAAEDRPLLTEIIDACLSHPAHQYRALDGSIVTLLNPAEQAYALLRSTDGMLLLPRYRLVRQEQNNYQEPTIENMANAHQGHMGYTTYDH